MFCQNPSVGKKDDKGRNIQVVVRCRPFNNVERKASSYSVMDCDSGRKEILVRTGGVGDKTLKKTYTFDMVFGPSAKQIEVYRSVVFPILDEVIMGYNCTVFAYGQTGTGKTFTMEGERSPNEEFTWEEDPLAGIIPRTLHQIFEKLTSNGTEFSVKVSLLEIYNEELFDLLSPSTDVNERLQMFDDPRNKRGVIIKGLEEISVHNKYEVYQILERGAAKRKTASTLMNAYSSRSHSVFAITIHMRETTVDGEELVKIGKLNLVDLAGSENIGRSGAVDKRAREAGNINQSLLTLGRVITALVERTPHIPYRESKLTRILQDSLGGRTKTSIIATVSPASVNLEETLSTLDYANRAKNIMNKPEVNQKLTKRTLIKEYTEEIERLKRDLSAAREKNGVYISSENYDFMNSKIVTQDEQISEFIEKIAAVEEEMKRVSELFTDSQKELEQYSSYLEEKEKELEMTQNNLQHTKQKLSEEVFVVSALQTTEEELYGVADQLLTTVDVSTEDVSGLHAKLDRKKEVEQHNAKMQESFAAQMDSLFNQMQKSVEQQSLKHQGMLELYTTSVGDLLNANATAFSGTLSTVAKSFASLKEIVDTEMTKSLDAMLKQESLCEEAKSSLQKCMEEHKAEMEEMLLARLLPGINSVLQLNNHLKLTLQSHSALAEKMETMKREMSTFFSEHGQALTKVREDTATVLASLKAEHDALKQEVNKANDKHTEGISQVISCLQNQLNLLALETQQNFKSVLNKTEALQASTSSFQQTMEHHCTNAVESANSQQNKFESSADNLIKEIRQASSEGVKVIEESSGYCTHLSTAVASLSEETEKWCSSTNSNIVSFADRQLSFLNGNRSLVQNLQQDVVRSCDSLSTEVTDQIRGQQGSAESALSALVEQVGSDKEMLMDHKIELGDQAQEGLHEVLRFLQEELKQDVPTGTTPQRKEFHYPRNFSKTRPRDVLLEQFRQKQQELQAAFNTFEPVQEEQVDQDSLEDDAVNGSNESMLSERSCIDDGIMCYENGRAPFFTRKKNQKKEKENQASTSLLDKSKTSESMEQSMIRSKLPLRLQN
ncbi:kinesin-like protein KIF11 [Acipenser ruthenus]|uniref:kinesin-like protein KIF11 n=1 Tax=Acipenser ruthenus TaxID=7906 RepID=UPI00145A6C1F|nr:kinesin-like protein KIF11 [Acipenser ruthenus]